MKLFNKSISSVSIMLNGTFLNVKPDSFSESFGFDFISYEKYKDRLKRTNLVLSPEHPYEERSLEALKIEYMKEDLKSTTKSIVKPIETLEVDPTEEVIEEV